MCFLLFVLALLVAILTADSLSRWNGVGSLCLGSISFRRRCIHRVSWSAWDAARYSASQVLRAIVFCRLLLHDIGDPKDVIRDPSCECRSFAEPKSASANVSIMCLLLFFV